MKICVPLLAIALGAPLLHSQVQAPDASPSGPLTVNFGTYSGGPSATDDEVLPGCTPVPGYDCEVQLAGAFYYPTPLTGTHPVVILLHGNHATCGHAYNPPPGGTDPPGLPGAPRIDVTITYTGTGACDAGNPIVVPSYRGYDYIANKLASWGYVVVSMDVNRGVNGLGGAPGVAGDYSLIRARGVLVLKTLALLSQWNATGDVPGSAGDILQAHLDLTQVGLMGHSRGGEGVRAAFSLFDGTTPTPSGVNPVTLNPIYFAANPWPGRIAGLNVRAIFEIGPTDAGQVDLPVAPTPTFTFFNPLGTVWNVLLPMCDGDVSDLEGVRPFDRSIMDLESPPIQKSTYTAWGTNHNFFNTQWQVTESFPTADICTGTDNNAIYPVSPGSPQQQVVGISSVLALMRGNVGVGTLPAATATITFNQNFNPPFGIPAQADGVAFPTRVDRGYSPPGTITTFDDFTVAGFNSTAPTLAHVTPNITVAYGTIPDHDPVLSEAAHISWAAANANNFFQTNWTANGKPGINIVPANYQTLDLRVSRQDDPANPLTTDFSIRLVGANGVMTRPVLLSTYLDPNFAGANPDFESDLTGPVGSTIELHPILQTVRIPLSAFGNVAFIAPQLHAVRLIFDQTATGAIYVTNIRLSTEIGGGATTYPPITFALPVERAFTTRPLQPFPQPGSTPLVKPCRILSVKDTSKAREFGGTPGYRIRVRSSSGAFPVRDAPLVMVIGTGQAPPFRDPQIIRVGSEPMVQAEEIFTLTPTQYQALPTQAHVILQFGSLPQPAEYWDCGQLP